MNVETFKCHKRIVSSLGIDSSLRRQRKQRCEEPWLILLEKFPGDVNNRGRVRSMLPRVY